MIEDRLIILTVAYERRAGRTLIYPDANDERASSHADGQPAMHAHHP